MATVYTFGLPWRIIRGHPAHGRRQTHAVLFTTKTTYSQTCQRGNQQTSLSRAAAQQKAPAFTGRQSVPPPPSLGAHSRAWQAFSPTQALSLGKACSYLDGLSYRRVGENVVRFELYVTRAQHLLCVAGKCSRAAREQTHGGRGGVRGAGVASSVIAFGSGPKTSTHRRDQPKWPHRSSRAETWKGPPFSETVLRQPPHACGWRWVLVGVRNTTT